MASRKTLKKALNNPNVRKFLDLLAYTEGTQGNGYHTAFGGGRLSSLADHPRYLKSFRQTNGKTNKTSAAGRYQFLKGTWDGLARQYGLTDFGPRNQDLGAVALLAQNGALPYVLKGDWNNAVAKSGRTWASLPTSPHPQPTKSWDKVNQFLGNHRPQQGAVVVTQPQYQPQRPDTVPVAQLQAMYKRPDTIAVSELEAMYKRPEAIPVEQLQAQQGQPSQPLSEPVQAEPQGFGTYDSIMNELPKLQQQGLNPYQALYRLAQRQDDVGMSIRDAYKQGMNAEQLTEYFGVHDLWQAPNEPLNNTLPKNVSRENLTTKLSLG